MLSRPDLRGDYQLVVGKNAMYCRGCPHCGHMGSCPLGKVAKVLKITEEAAGICLRCRSEYQVTMMMVSNIDGSNIREAVTYHWKPMPDLDDKYELDAAADNLRKEKLVTYKDALTGRRMKGSTR